MPADIFDPPPDPYEDMRLVLLHPPLTVGAWRMIVDSLAAYGDGQERREATHLGTNIRRHLNDYVERPVFTHLDDVMYGDEPSPRS
jgi:hypothetical protein